MIMKVVPDAVQQRPPILMKPSDLVSDAAKKMCREKQGAVLIQDQGKVVGIFTERDVSIRAVGSDLNPKKTHLADVMTADVKSISVGETVFAVFEQMKNHHIRRMPIMDGEELVGMVGIREILRSMIEQTSGDLEHMHVALPQGCEVDPHLYQKGKLAALPPNASVHHAAGLMKAHGIGSILVMQHSELLGIFTERDVSFRVVAKNLSPDATALEEVMTDKLVTVAPSEPCLKVAEKMRDGHFRHLPVIEDGKPVGILSIRDLYSYIQWQLGEHFREAMVARTRQMIVNHQGL